MLETSSGSSGPPGPFRKLKSALGMLGPGLITGASDDDPSGIAAYSQVGAQFGYAMLWTMVLSYPLMAAIQEVSARVGRVTGGGISANLRRYYPPWLLYLVIAIVLVANIFNLGADIGAMGAAAQLLLPAQAWIYIVGFGVASLLLQIFVPYRKYASYLKWLTLSLFAYIATAFYVRIDWREAIHSSLIPHVTWSKAYLTGIVAVFGTTISPYLFFWQASQEVEGVKTTRGEKALKRAPRQARPQLERIRVDTYVGMALSNIVAFFIVLTTAATLHVHGETDAGTAPRPPRRWRRSPDVGPRDSLRAALSEPECSPYRFWPVRPVMPSGKRADGRPVWNIDRSTRSDSIWQLRLLPWQVSISTFSISIRFVLYIGQQFSMDRSLLLSWRSSCIWRVVRRVMEKFAVPRYLQVVGWSATVVMFGASIAALIMWRWH